MAICRKNIAARSYREVIQPEPVALAAPPSDGGVRAAVTGRIRLMRLGEVIEMTGLGKTKIYELQAQGEFPPRVRITATSVGWVESEVQEWLATRIALSRVPTPTMPQLTRSVEAAQAAARQERQSSRE